MTKQYKKISEETLHTNPWWTYKHDIYQTPTGKQGDYYYGVTPGNAMIIPILEDGRIILVLQERYLMGRQSTEFPCGGKKEGQSFQDTAKQELFEETGLTATSLRLVYQ